MLAGAESDTLWRVRKLPGNQFCCDCGRKRPEWASISLGLLLCINCAGEHRSLGVYKSKIRSITMDSWSQEQLRSLTCGGNQKLKRYFRRCRLPWNMLSIAERYSTPQADAYRSALSSAARTIGGKLNISNLPNVAWEISQDHSSALSHSAVAATPRKPEGRHDNRGRSGRSRRYKKLALLTDSDDVRLKSRSVSASLEASHAPRRRASSHSSSNSPTPRAAGPGTTTASTVEMDISKTTNRHHSDEMTSDASDHPLNGRAAAANAGPSSWRALDRRSLLLVLTLGVCVFTNALITSVIFPFVPYVAAATGSARFDASDGIFLGAMVSLFLGGLELGTCLWRAVAHRWGHKAAFVASIVLAVLAGEGLAFSGSSIPLATTCLILGITVGTFEFVPSVMNRHFDTLSPPGFLQRTLHAIALMAFTLGPLAVSSLIIETDSTDDETDVASNPVLRRTSDNARLLGDPADSNVAVQPLATTTTPTPAVTQLMLSLPGTAQFPLLKVGQLLAVASLLSLLLVLSFVSDAAVDGHQGHSRRGTGRVKARGRDRKDSSQCWQQMPSRSYQMVSLGSWDRLPVGRVPQASPAPSPHVELPSQQRPVAFFPSDNDLESKDAQSGIKDVQLGKKSNSLDCLGQDSRPSQHHRSHSNVDALDRNRLSQGSISGEVRVNEGHRRSNSSVSARESGLFASPTFSILLAAPSASSPAAGHVTSESRNKSKGSALAPDDHGASSRKPSANHHSSRVLQPEVLDAFVPCQRRLAQALICIVPFAERFAQQALALWIIAPAAGGGLQWTALDIGVFYCVTRLVTFGFLLITRHKLSPAQQGRLPRDEPKADAEAQTGASISINRTGVTGSLQRWFSVSAIMCCVLLPFIPVQPASGDPYPYFGSSGDSLSPAPAPTPAPATSNLAATAAALSSAVNAVWWVVFVLITSALQTCLTTLTNWVTALANGVVESGVVADESSAAQLMHPTFGAICAIFRVAAPTVATLIFLQSLLPTLAASDGVEAGAATVVASEMELNFRSVFFILAVLCAAVALCVFAFFGQLQRRAKL
eukprot:INCI2097.1.p1 GENE.INCI2097.1~~INCI2097.1.p1  ORF type:complete len:1052 (+),score=115.91 INCI2097.1:188-3343(+)